MGSVSSLLKKTDCMLCEAISSSVIRDLRNSDHSLDFDEVLCTVNGPFACATQPCDESERGLLFYFCKNPKEWQLKCKVRIKISDPRNLTPREVIERMMKRTLALYLSHSLC
jgi:hypothetical protein